MFATAPLSRRFYQRARRQKSLFSCFCSMALFLSSSCVILGDSVFSATIQTRRSHGGTNKDLFNSDRTEPSSARILVGGNLPSPERMWRRKRAIFIEFLWR